MSTIRFVKKSDDLLKTLREIPSAKESYGEASFGYSFELKDGSILEIGQSDDDVADPHICWIKTYKGSTEM